MMNMNWNPMNEEQANALFAEHAMLIGMTDRVPYHVAVELFGEEAATFARTETYKNGSNEWYGGIEINGNGFYYLTQKGFKACIAYLNCMSCMEANIAQQKKIQADNQKDDERTEAITGIMELLHSESSDMIRHDNEGTITADELAQMAEWLVEAERIIGDDEPLEALKRVKAAFGIEDKEEVKSAFCFGNQN